MENDNIVLNASKFLKQLQDEAYKTIKGKIKFNDNVFNGDGFWYVDGKEIGSNISTYHIQFKFNGKEIIVEGEIENTFSLHSKKELIQKIYASIRDKVETIIIQDIEKVFHIERFDEKMSGKLATII